MSILIGMAVLAEVVKMLGDITVINNTLTTIKNAPIATMALMSMITFFTGALLSSGNASWYAFGPLVPDVTAQMGVLVVTTALPVQLSSGIRHHISPVAGVVIAIPDMAELDITGIVKKYSISAAVMYIYSLAVSYSVI